MDGYSKVARVCWVRGGIALLGCCMAVLCHSSVRAQEQGLAPPTSAPSAPLAPPTSAPSTSVAPPPAQAAFEVPPPPAAPVVDEPAEPEAGSATQSIQGPSSPVTLSAAPGSTQASTFDAGTLERLFPGVVQVRCGDNWATGFVYPTVSHVVTVHTAVNEDCVPMVTRADGVTQTARVVAWSVDDDIVILQVKQTLTHQPLRLSLARPPLASPVAVLRVQAHWADSAAAPSPENVRPVLHFGHIVGSRDDVLLVGPSSFVGGDRGAPVITDSGDVIGVLRYSTRDTVPAATPTEKVERLAQGIGRQGEFEADPPALRGLHSGVFFSPLSTDDTIGGGLMSGYRYGWFAGQLDMTFLQSSFALVDGAAKSTTLMSVDVYATFLAQVERNSAIFLAPGASVGFESSKTAQLDDLSVEPEEETDRFFAGRVAFGAFDGRLFARGVVGFPNPFYRLDLGVYFDDWRKR